MNRWTLQGKDNAGVLPVLQSPAFDYVFVGLEISEDWQVCAAISPDSVLKGKGKHSRNSDDLLVHDRQRLYTDGVATGLRPQRPTRHISALELPFQGGTSRRAHLSDGRGPGGNRPFGEKSRPAREINDRYVPSLQHDLADARGTWHIVLAS